MIASSSSAVFGLARPMLAALVAVAFAACGKSDNSQIIVYRIPKEQPPAQPAESGGAGDQAASVHWIAPPGWEEQPTSGFRKGSYLVRGADGKTADVSVISFPETAGGVLANVNRWRGQLKLPPIGNEAEIGAPLAVAGHDMFFVDLASEEPITDGAKARLLGGIYLLPGETWFFKMTGPDELVTTQKDAFRQFISSVHLAEGEAHPIAQSASASGPMSANSGGSKTDAPPKSEAEAVSAPPLQYKLPADWKEKPPSSMRVASFKSVAPGGKETDISVITLPGTAGGDLANVNRWRGQLNLPPIDEATLEKSAERLSANNRDYLLVDLESEAPVGDQPEKQRILAAISCQSDHCWFIKMTGETAAVASQKSAFREFLRSLKLP